MRAGDLFISIAIIAFGIGAIVVAFYAAVIIAPIIAVGFLIILTYSFLTSEPLGSKCKKSKRKRRR